MDEQQAVGEQQYNLTLSQAERDAIADFFTDSDTVAILDEVEEGQYELLYGVLKRLGIDIDEDSSPSTETETEAETVDDGE